MASSLHFYTGTLPSLYSQLSHSLASCSYNSNQNSVRFGAVPRPRPLLTTASFAADTPLGTNVADTGDRSLEVKKKGFDISPALKGTSIFLVGINNSVKTSMGKQLAEALRYYYFDSDNLVIEAAGDQFSSKSFRESDGKEFRESETEVFKQLSSMGRLVVCAGDGAVQSSTNLSLMRHGISLWIDVPLDMVAIEMTRGQLGDPILEASNSESESEVLAQLMSRYEKLRGGYSTADAVISLQKVANRLGLGDLNAVTTEDITLEVLFEMEKLSRVKKMMEAAAMPF